MPKYLEQPSNCKFGQRLAQQVSVRFSIDPAEGTEPIRAILRSIFPGKLIIEDEAKAGIANLKLWCDGSKLDSGGTGAAVVWKKEGTEEEWQEQKVGLGRNKEIFDAEMWGISEAVKVAEQKVRQVREPWAISIFCDSQTIINSLRECDSCVGQALKIQIYQKAKKLVQQGHSISIRWVPSHIGVEGNKRADKAAKEAASGERVRTAKWASLTHVKRQIQDEKKLQISIWHEEKTREREVGRRGFYIPCLKTQIHPLLGKTKKLYASRFYQLKTGHGAIGTFLERIGAVESAECWWCGDGEQSVMHLYTKCQKWRTQRRGLKKSLDKIGIQWQRRPERKWLAELLANERAVGPLLEYLKDTEVGSREGAVEKTMEWRRRNDQEGEEQLGSP